MKGANRTRWIGGGLLGAGIAVWLAADAAWAGRKEESNPPKGSAADRKAAVDEAAAAAGHTAPTMPTSGPGFGGRAPTGGRKPPGMGDERKEMVDLNSATLLQLKALPGVSPVDAEKILENRPYRHKEELTSKKILPKATYDKIRDRLTAVQSKSENEKPKANGTEKHGGKSK